MSALKDLMRSAQRPATLEEHIKNPIYKKAKRITRTALFEFAFSGPHTNKSLNSLQKITDEIDRLKAERVANKLKNCPNFYISKIREFRLQLKAVIAFNSKEKTFLESYWKACRIVEQLMAEPVVVDFDIDKLNNATIDPIVMNLQEHLNKSSYEGVLKLKYRYRYASIF